MIIRVSKSKCFQWSSVKTLKNQSFAALGHFGLFSQVEHDCPSNVSDKITP